MILQSITITKSRISNMYICKEKISYDFYLLFLLATEKLSNTTQKNIGIEFYKNSSMQCITTSQLFIHKNHGYIELFSMYDLKDTQDLNLPKSPKFLMTAKNFMNFMAEKQKIEKLAPHKFFIALDQHGHAYITTNIASLQKQSWFALIQKKWTNLFTKSTN